MQSTSLKEFRSTLSDSRGLGVYLFAGSAGVPLADLAVHIGPGWPPGVPTLFVLVAGLANLITFHWLHQCRQSTVARAAYAAATATIVFFSLYWVTMTRLTVAVPNLKWRVAVGSTVSADAKAILEAASQVPLQGVPRLPEDLLKRPSEERGDPQDQALRIWKPDEVYRSRTLLIIYWALCVACLGCLTMSFTIYHRRKSVPEERTKEVLGGVTSKKAKSGAASTTSPKRAPNDKSKVSKEDDSTSSSSTASDLNKGTTDEEQPR
jgi:hypothetical protein